MLQYCNNKVLDYRILLCKGDTIINAMLKEGEVPFIYILQSICRAEKKKEFAKI